MMLVLTAVKILLASGADIRCLNLRECVMSFVNDVRFNAGPWQVMLKQADGSYACIAESATRFTLGEVCV